MYNATKEDIIRAGIIGKIDISNYVRDFLLELSKSKHQRIKINTELDVSQIKALMNDPRNTKFKSTNDFRDGEPLWKYQEVEYIPSNLGRDKGFLFYFVCTSCGLRAKYLFFYNSLKPPICRFCCRLPYRQATYQERKSRIPRLKPKSPMPDYPDFHPPKKAYFA